MDNQKNLHIVVMPWLAFGHIIPFLELAKSLASKGHQISFVSAPRNLQRLPKIPEKLAPLINLVPLQLPSVENLPPNAEATTDLPFDKVILLMQAYDKLGGPMRKFLETSTPVDWIIHDFNPWIAPIADSFGIRKAFFQASNIWSLSVATPLPPSTNASKEDMQKNDLFDRLLEEKKNFVNTNGVSVVTGLTVRGCDVVSSRSCMELEAEAIQLFQKLHGKPVFPVGMMPPSVEGEEEGETWMKIKGWLEGQKKESVLYIALGSETAPSQEQLTELAHGLEMSGLPFLWVLRRPMGSSLELPEGFEERNKGCGLVCESWVPQCRILSHESVGAFLTHCGPASVIEALLNGKPLLMLPFVLDQLLVAKNMEEKKVGLRFSRNNEGRLFTRNEVAETVTRMLQDGEIYKAEAKKMGKIFADETLHSNYMDKFDQYLRTNRPVRE